MGAENQQERLIQLGWVIGFVDGEGCFSIGFIRQLGRIGRKGCKTGYQVFHEFAVTQGARSASCLYELRDFFGVGRVHVNRRADNHEENVHRYAVRRSDDLLRVVRPFFALHRMHSSKQRDFEKFARCVEMVAQGVHLTHVGLADIAGIVETMNRQKPRSEMIRILRDHTPEVQDTGP